jgi:hypothetical protein
MFRNDTWSIGVIVRANGAKFGRPRKVNARDQIALAKRMKSDGYTGKQISQSSG